MSSSPDIIKDASDALRPISDRGITVMQGWYDKDIHSCCRRKEDGQNNRRPLPLRRIRACTVRAVIKNKDIKKRTTPISGCRPCVIMNL